MCGVSARTMRSSSTAGRDGSSSRSSARDLGRVRDEHLLLVDARRLPVERLDQQVTSERFEATGERSVGVIGADRLGCLGAHRPIVEPCAHAHDRHARDRVPGDDRPLDRSGAAPPWKQRRVDVEHRPARQQRLLDERAEGTHADRLWVDPRDRLDRLRIVHRGGLVQRDPELAGGVGDRRRRQLSAASAGAVRPGDDELGAVR